jgi:predicted amidophosphoribosyltransferase
MLSPGAEYVLDAIRVAVAVGFPVLCVIIWRRSKERRRRWNNDLCPECGYDLRASTGKCPECGNPIRKNL